MTALTVSERVARIRSATAAAAERARAATGDPVSVGTASTGVEND
jgi:hypothetical protein